MTKGQEPPPNALAQPATVYLARTGRRYLTKRGAIMASVNWFFRQHCECESSEHDERGYTSYAGFCCRYHDPETSPRIRARLARHLSYNDLRSR